MKTIFEIEVAANFYDTLIGRIIDKLDIDTLDDKYPLDDEENPIIVNVVQDVFNWAVAVAMQINGVPRDNEYIEKTHFDLIEKGFDFPKEEIASIIDGIVAKCDVEIKAWVMLFRSFIEYGTVNDNMVNSVATQYGIDEYVPLDIDEFDDSDEFNWDQFDLAEDDISELMK